MTMNTQQRLAQLILDFNWGELETVASQIGIGYIDNFSDNSIPLDHNMTLLPLKLAATIFAWAENVVEESSDE